MHPHVPIIATALGAIVWLWLMHNRSLPLVSMCAHRARVRENCYHDLKNINEFLAHLRNGTFSVQY